MSGRLPRVAAVSCEDLKAEAEALCYSLCAANSLLPHHNVQAPGLRFIVDIGASTCRVALVPASWFGAGDGGGPECTLTMAVHQFDCRSVDRLTVALHNVAEALGDSLLRHVVAAVVAVPGTVRHDVVGDDGARVGTVVGPVANYEGADQLIHLDSLPEALLPRHHTTVLNDLEACAHGVEFVLRCEDGAVTGEASAFEQLFKQVSSHRAHHRHRARGACGGLSAALRITGHHATPMRVVVMAPGTGLGTALLILFSGSKGAAVPSVVVPMEWGRSSLAAVGKEDEELRRVRRQWLRAYESGPTGSTAWREEGYELEAEDLCSGRGLQWLYEYVRWRDGAAAVVPESRCELPPEVLEVDADTIGRQAREGDAVSQRALFLYFKYLMRVASQLAVGLVPHAVLLCGTTIAVNGAFLDSTCCLSSLGLGDADAQASTVVDDALAAWYRQHSMERLGFVSQTPLFRQRVELNLNLLGCATLASRSAPRSHEPLGHGR